MKFMGGDFLCKKDESQRAVLEKKKIPIMSLSDNFPQYIHNLIRS